MSKQDAREAYRKTGKERKRRDENKDTRSGGAMEDNSINARALASRNDNSTGRDSERAVSFQHAQDNMANSRVIQGVEGEGTGRDSERGVGSGHQKDNSTNSRVLASFNNNAYGEDDKRAVSFQHLQDNAGNQRVVASHTPAEGVNPDSENYAKGGGATRGVDTQHIVPWAIKPQHIEDNTMAWTKMKDKAPASKIPDLPADRIASGTLDGARIPALGPGKIEVDRRGGGKINAQEAYLKTEVNAGFEGGHGNTHHNPEFVPKNSQKSISFGALPPDAMEAMVTNRQTIRDQLANGATGTAAIQALQRAALYMYHGYLDSPEMTGDALVSAIQNNADYGEIYGLSQIIPTPDDAHFLKDRGPDIVAGGTAGTIGTTNQTWYPPKETSVLKAQAMTRSDRSLTASYSDVPTDSHMFAILATRMQTDSEYTIPAGWTRLSISDPSGNIYRFRIYYRTKAANQNSATFTIGGTLPFEGALVALDSYVDFRAKIVNRNPQAEPPDDTPRAFGAKCFPRGKSIVSFTTPAGSHPVALIDSGFTELVRLEGPVGWTNFYLGVRDSESSDFIEPVSLLNANPTGSSWGSLIFNTKPRKKTNVEALAEARIT